MLIKDHLHQIGKKFYISSSAFSEDGKLRYTNLSYFLFYDGLRQPITAAINAGERAKKEGKNTTEAIKKAVLDGVFTQLEPFFVDKIVVEKLMDVLVRDGRRKTGAKVWNRGDPWGTKVKKGYTMLFLIRFYQDLCLLK